jgi:hypothetical protein
VFDTRLRLLSRANSLLIPPARIAAGAASSFRGFEATLGAEVGERCPCGTIQGSAVRSKLRTMTRAVPTLLERIPLDDAAHMRAGGRVRMQTSLLVTADGYLFEPAAQQCALAGFEAFDIRDIGHREQFRQAAQHGHVLVQIFADAFRDGPRRIVGFCPRVIAIEDETRNRKRRDDAVGDSLTGIAGCDVTMLVASVPADEADIVCGFHDLAGPAMGDLAHFRKTCACPGFQRREPRVPVISLTRFVVFASDNDDVLMFGLRLPRCIVAAKAYVRYGACFV